MNSVDEMPESVKGYKSNTTNFNFANIRTIPDRHASTLFVRFLRRRGVSSGFNASLAFCQIKASLYGVETHVVPTSNIKESLLYTSTRVRQITDSARYYPSLYKGQGIPEVTRLEGLFAMTTTYKGLGIDSSVSLTFTGLPKPKMTSFDSYNAKTTSISYPWPTEVTGIERIALSAQGDLQRVLSAFFARPIVIALVYSETTRQKSLQSAPEPVQSPSESIISSAFPEAPITQTRQVHLQCAGKIVCTATSTVRITSPECARLFLQEKYAIGQMFRRLEKVPAFELLSVGLGAVKDNEKQSPSSFIAGEDDAGKLWRKYTLVIPHFECEILEVFPSREMFVGGERWLTAGKVDSVPELGQAIAMKSAGLPSMSKQSLSLVLAAGFIIMFFFEIALYTGGRSRFC